MARSACAPSRSGRWIRWWFTTARELAIESAAATERWASKGGRDSGRVCSRLARRRTSRVCCCTPVDLRSIKTAWRGKCCLEKPLILPVGNLDHAKMRQMRRQVLHFEQCKASFAQAKHQLGERHFGHVSSPMEFGLRKERAAQMDAVQSSG